MLHNTTSPSHYLSTSTNEVAAPIWTFSLYSVKHHSFSSPCFSDTCNSEKKPPSTRQMWCSLATTFAFLTKLKFVAFLYSRRNMITAFSKCHEETLLLCFHCGSLTFCCRLCVVMLWCGQMWFYVVVCEFCGNFLVVYISTFSTFQLNSPLLFFLFYKVRSIFFCIALWTLQAVTKHLTGILKKHLNKNAKTR